jgi:hypothetical protein
MKKELSVGISRKNGKIKGNVQFRRKAQKKIEEKKIEEKEKASTTCGRIRSNNCPLYAGR